MKRRNFLALLGLAPAAPLVAKELLEPAPAITPYSDLQIDRFAPLLAWDVPGGKWLTLDEISNTWVAVSFNG